MIQDKKGILLSFIILKKINESAFKLKIFVLRFNNKKIQNLTLRL